MKFSLKIITIVLTVSLISCSKDFLDKQNPTELGVESFYQTEDQINQGVIGIYGELQRVVANQWFFQEFITDNTTVHFNEGNRGNAPNIESIEYWQYNSNSGKFNEIYVDIYSAIGNINTVLFKLSDADIDADVKSVFEGEVKFIRAYFYYLLAEYFGDAIIVKEPIQNPSEAFEFLRSPVAEVYEFIESDLETSISTLPTIIPPSEAGRLSKGAALMLKAKVMFAQKDFPGGKLALDQLVSLNRYDILPNYADIFDPNNKNHVESIFEIQFQGNNELGESSGFIYNFYPLYSQGAVTGFPGIDGNGWNIPTNNMIAAYESGDLRKDVSLSEGYINNSGDYVAIPFIEKFHHPHTIVRRPDDNWPVFRYADVLLMLAEAINEISGPTAEAYGHVNRVRDRADLGPLTEGLSKEQFNSAILDERRVELAFENHRWFDLKRMLSTTELVAFLNAHGEEEMANPTTPRGSIGFSAGDYIFEEFEILFPLPANELLVNPKLKQNNGY